MFEISIECIRTYKQLTRHYWPRSANLGEPLALSISLAFRCLRDRNKSAKWACSRLPDQSQKSYIRNFRPEAHCAPPNHGARTSCSPNTPCPWRSDKPGATSPCHWIWSWSRRCRTRVSCVLACFWSERSPKIFSWAHRAWTFWDCWLQSVFRYSFVANSSNLRMDNTQRRHTHNLLETKSIHCHFFDSQKKTCFFRGVGFKENSYINLGE